MILPSWGKFAVPLMEMTVIIQGRVQTTKEVEVQPIVSRVNGVDRQSLCYKTGKVISFEYFRNGEVAVDRRAQDD